MPIELAGGRRAAETHKDDGTMKRKNLVIVAGLSLAVAGMLAVANPALAFGPRGGGEGGWGAHGGPGGFGPGGFGPAGGADRGQLLADALGISLDELHAAQEQAFTKGLDQAVADGRLTREQADLMLAGRLLRTLIDRQALTAQILGMTPEELQAAHDAGKTLRDLLAAKGIDPQDFQSQMQAAVDQIIAKAVADGLITQAQADALKAHPGGMRGGVRGGMRGEPGAGPGVGPGEPGSGRGIGRGRGGLSLPGSDL